eukprot:GGOE01020701.1.p1 GENE.GGOE01020701.1~~GGOE01020701.1.p1  ORF type:complete len:601 (+),score=168.74 GGOE01020701.1:144-1805(+)
MEDARRGLAMLRPPSAANRDASPASGEEAFSPSRRRIRDIFSRSKSPMITPNATPSSTMRQPSEVVGDEGSPTLRNRSEVPSRVSSSVVAEDAQSDSSFSPTHRKLRDLFHSKDNSPNFPVPVRPDSDSSNSSMSPTFRKVRDRLSPLSAGSPLTREGSEVLGDAETPSHSRTKGLITRAISKVHSPRDSDLSPKAINRHVESSDFPSMEGVPAQMAVRQWFVWANRDWRELDVAVQILPTRFASGSTYCFHFMKMSLPDGQERRCVCRQRKDGTNDEEQLRLEVISSATAQALAERFNMEKPTIKIIFLDSFLVRTSDGKLWGVEPFLPGKHEVHAKKHGLPDVGEHHKSPQAFSHYTWEYSKRKVMVLGLSGAGDYFRDPIIHTHDGCGFGVYNGGMEAIQQFFDTHWCNKICNYFELEMHMAKKLERKVGDLYIGNGDTTETRRRLYMGDFVGKLEARPGAGTAEELTVLGLDRRKYDRLVEIFYSLDLNLSGDLDETEVGHVLEKAKTVQRNAAESEAYFRFAERLKYELDKRTCITFKKFVLCWTGNN